MAKTVDVASLLHRRALPPASFSAHLGAERQCVRAWRCGATLHRPPRTLTLLRGCSGFQRAQQALRRHARCSAAAAASSARRDAAAPRSLLGGCSGFQRAQ